MRRAAASVLRAALVAGLAVVLPGCGTDRDMPEAAEMPDTAQVRRALDEPGARDSMLDTVPGGEMARGDTAAARRLLRDKMP